MKCSLEYSREFKSLALQEIQFGDNAILKNIVTSEVGMADGEEVAGGPTSNGSVVSFTLTGVLTPSMIAYEGITPRSKVSLILVFQPHILVIRASIRHGQR